MSEERGPEYYMKTGMELLGKKKADYTTHSRYENFERSALITDWFKSDIDKVFVTLISTKLTRLASLLDRKEPNNESIQDTFVDLINYCALWAGKRMSQYQPNQYDTRSKQPNIDIYSAATKSLK